MRKIAMKKIVAVLVMGLAGCGGGSGGTSAPVGPQSADGVELLKGFNVDPAPANGFRVVLPIVRGINPGDSLEYCSWTNMILGHDVDIKSAKGMQSATGHHIVIYYTNVVQPAGTQRVCTDDDMASFRFTVAAAGEGVSQVQILPGDLVAHIPKGSQIVVNHHYLNPGDKTVDAQTAVNVAYNDPGAPAVPSGAVAWLNTNIKIPPGAYGVDIKCTMQHDVPFWLLIPHMHKWGQHITVDHASGTGTNRLFDVAWDPDYTFHPPQVKNDPTSPYVMKAGDSMAIHCDWNNTTGNNLTFGLEMCVAFGQTIDSQGLGNIQCDEGKWGTF